MATMTYTDLTTIVADTSMAAATAENILDQAINILATHLAPYGATISNMTGTAGSKTWSGTQEEKGAILAEAMEIYQYYKTSGSNAQSVSVSGLGYSSSTSQGGGSGRINDLAERLAKQLTEMETSIG